MQSLSNYEYFCSQIFSPVFFILVWLSHNYYLVVVVKKIQNQKGKKCNYHTDKTKTAKLLWVEMEIRFIYKTKEAKLYYTMN